MRVLSYDERNPFVEVPERGREPTLSEPTDPRNESVVERCEDAAGREALFFYSAQFFVLLRDPRVHERAEETLMRSSVAASITLALRSGSARCYAARQSKTSSKNSPARRPV